MTTELLIGACGASFFLGAIICCPIALIVGLRLGYKLRNEEDAFDLVVLREELQEVSAKLSYEEGH